MATKKPARLTRRAALAAAGAGAATALGALLTPAQATTYRPTVRRTPYNRYYSDRYGRRTRIVISDYYGSSYSHYYYYGGQKIPSPINIYCKTALHSCSAVFPLDAAGITRTTVRKPHHR